MLESLALKLFTGLHLAGIGTFFSCALFLDFAVLPALRFLPPDQATKISAVVEPRFMLVGNAAIAVVGVSGVLLLAIGGLASQLGDATFLASPRGTALIAGIALWIALAASQFFYLRHLRPQLPQAFPFDAFRTAETVPETALAATRQARLVLRAQAVACMVAVVWIGGATRYGA